MYTAAMLEEIYSVAEYDKIPRLLDRHSRTLCSPLKVKLTGISPHSWNNYANKYFNKKHIVCGDTVVFKQTFVS